MPAQCRKLRVAYFLSAQAVLCCAGCREVEEPAPRGVAAVASVSAEPPPGAGAEPNDAQADNAPVEWDPVLRQSHERMLKALQEIAQRAAEENPYAEDRTLREARERLAALPKGTSGDAIWKTKYEVAMYEYRLGHEEVAITHFQELLSTIGRAAAGRNPANRVKLAYQLGEACLRHAETLNCCQRYTPESCVFPIQGAGVHERKEASRRAIAYFLQALRGAPIDSKVHLSARWLLNIAYMTTGEYPDQVPPEYLIPPENFRSDAEFPRFKNISTEIGLGTLSLSGGVIADDFNDDGDIDLIVSSWSPDGQIRFFRNNGAMSFTDVTPESGLIGICGGLNLVQADYDNDGDTDVLVLRGAWLSGAGKHPNSLLQNQGDGRFIDVAYAAGLAGEDHPTQTGAWADYDRDGDLDLYVGNEPTEGRTAQSQLFRNNGDGTFTDVAPAAGVTNDSFAKAVVWGDYDADGDPDLYVSNLGGPNRLYRNDGDGTFTDVAFAAGVELPIASFPAWFWDYDNDGHLDLYVSGYSAHISDLAASYLGKPTGAEMARLYRNQGDGTFANVALQANLTRPSAPMGSNFGDLDNDGYLDFYLGTGDTTYGALMPNLMFWNRGGESFTDVTFAGGFGSLQKGHGVAFADFDHDGDQDVFEQMGGALPGDHFVDAFYENPGFGNHWIALQLRGTQSNRSAIGARIRVTVLENGRQRTIYRHVDSGGSFGANPLRQTIGLGRATQIEELQVDWPASGVTQVFTRVPKNRFYRISEGRDDLQPFHPAAP